MMFCSKPVVLLISVVGLWTGSIRSSGITLEELRRDPSFSPERLLQTFANFTFELGEEVQAPEAFLKEQRGDCDDFATLAADLLKEKGYTARLVVVFMPKDIHVVCYVAEAKGYLDFNNRAATHPVVECEGTLTDIAEKVAESFQCSWHCASEFTFQNGIRRFVYTDFRQAEKPAEATAKALTTAATPKS